METSLTRFPHELGERLANRYLLTDLAGRGTFGTTYVARDRQTQQFVAVKVLSLQQMSDWKVLDLFQREAKVLAHLNHPHIPKYVDSFSLDVEVSGVTDRRFYLVQELIEGESCQDWVERAGWLPEAEVQDVAVQVLKILRYIHSLSPPIIHRDIKPANLIRRSDGQIFLVDFGAVQDVYRNTLTCGGTFVGTLGYMPMEQLQGRVQSRSDLYSLGATLVYLMTGRSPMDLPQSWIKLQFRPYIPASTAVSPAFADWLERLLEPVAEDRFPSADAALQDLQDQVNWHRIPLQPQRWNKNVWYKATQSRFRLEIHPPSWNERMRNSIIVTLVLYACYLLCIAFAAISPFPVLITLLFCPVVLCLCLIWSVFQSLYTLEIDHQVFTLTSHCLGYCYFRHTGQTADLALVDIDTRVSAKGYRSHRLILWEGVRQHVLLQGYSQLTVQDVVSQIRQLLKQVQS